MSDLALSVTAIIVSCLAAGGNLLIQHWRKHHIQALVVVRMGKEELGRQRMTLARWRATCKMTSEQLSNLVQGYGFKLDPTRSTTVGRLSGIGGGRKRKLSIPVLKGPHDTPDQLIVQARW